MQCSLCKANGKSSSFIPPSSSESVDKCVTVEAIDVDLDRNEDGDEYEETEDGVDRVDGVLGDDGDDGDEVVVVFDDDDFGETLPTAPALQKQHFSSTTMTKAETNAAIRRYPTLSSPKQFPPRTDETSTL